MKRWRSDFLLIFWFAFFCGRFESQPWHLRLRSDVVDVVIIVVVVIVVVAVCWRFAPKLCIPYDGWVKSREIRLAVDSLRPPRKLSTARFVSFRPQFNLSPQKIRWEELFSMRILRIKSLFAKNFCWKLLSYGDLWRYSVPKMAHLSLRQPGLPKPAAMRRRKAEELTSAFLIQKGDNLQVPREAFDKIWQVICVQKEVNHRSMTYWKRGWSMTGSIQLIESGEAPKEKKLD